MAYKAPKKGREFSDLAGVTHSNGEPLLVPDHRSPKSAGHEVQRRHVLPPLRDTPGQVVSVTSEEVVRPRIIEMTVERDDAIEPWDKAMFSVPVDPNRPWGSGGNWRLIELEEALLRARATGAPDHARVYLAYTSQSVSVQVPKGGEVPPSSYALELKHKERKDTEARERSAARRKLRRVLAIGSGVAVGGPPVLIGLVAGLWHVYDWVLRAF